MNFLWCFCSTDLSRRSHTKPTESVANFAGLQQQLKSALQAVLAGPATYGCKAGFCALVCLFIARCFVLVRLLWAHGGICGVAESSRLLVCLSVCFGCDISYGAKLRFANDFADLARCGSLICSSLALLFFIL